MGGSEHRDVHLLHANEALQDRLAHKSPTDKKRHLRTPVKIQRNTIKITTKHQ